MCQHLGVILFSFPFLERQAPVAGLGRLAIGLCQDALRPCVSSISSTRHPMVPGLSETGCLSRVTSLKW